MEAGADLNEKDWFRGQPILANAAASNPNPAVLTALIKAGADVNEKGIDGATAS